MNWILLAFVGVALLCPVTMFGPAVLHRLGLRKRPSSSTSCMPTRPGPSTDSMDARFRAKRAEFDREIAVIEAGITKASPEIGIVRSPSID